MLDAGPIIGLHDLGIWSEFTQRYEVVIPQVVCEDEALFHSRDDATGDRALIDLRDDIADGRVRLAAADMDVVARTSKRFSAAIELHAGELEALSLLNAVPGYEEHVFCTGDGAAIQAACLLGLSERCESVEVLLRLVGLGREVPWWLSKRFMEHHKQEGGKRLITGFGLAE
jgi:hypothetical protein